MKKSPEPMRVMVLMEDDIIRSFVARTLRSRGHAVVELSEADEAMDELDADVFDVVTVEYQWLSRNGVAEYKRIRTKAGARSRFVIQAALAANVPDSLVRRGLDVVLPKPFTLRQLVAAVEARRGRRRYQPDIQYRGLMA